MRIKSVDELARPVSRYACFNIDCLPRVSRQTIPIVRHRLANQRTLASTNECVGSILESQQQAIRSLGSRVLKTNSGTRSVVAERSTRYQILIVELDTAVNIQLGLKCEVVSRVAATEAELIPLNGQVLVRSRAEHLIVHMGGSGTIVDEQIIPEWGDGRQRR